MKTSVVIPYFGKNNEDENKLNNCIEKINESNELPDEIIIVDDCSYIKPKKNIQLKSKVKLHLYFLEENKGPGAARNFGVNKSKGELIIFFDSDVEVHQNTIKLIKKSIINCDAIVGIYSKKNLDEKIWGRYKALFYFYVHTLNGYKKIEYDQFSASCCAIRKKVFISIGGYAKWIKPGMDIENEELGNRITKSHKILLDPNIQVDHHFPLFNKMTKTFYQRSSLWFQLFTIKRKFSKTAGTKSTGIYVIASFACLCFFIINLFFKNAQFDKLSIFFLLIHIIGFIKFYLFLLKNKNLSNLFLPVIHFYFSVIISLGILDGFLKVIFRKSIIKKALPE